jgi:hypothetical protein
LRARQTGEGQSDLIVGQEDIDGLVFLAERPVLSREFAAWRDGHSSGIALDASGGASAAVGMSRPEAEAFAAWASDRAGASLKEAGATICLPKAHWLQVATLGPALDNLLADGSGPLGHQQMTGHLWQWTTDNSNDGLAALAFGGGKGLGDGSVPSAHKMLFTNYADLCRRVPQDACDPALETGIRLAMVIPVKSEKETELEQPYPENNPDDIPRSE